MADNERTSLPKLGRAKRRERKAVAPLIPPMPYKPELTATLKQEICGRREKAPAMGEVRAGPAARGAGAVYWWSEGGGRRLGQLKLKSGAELTALHHTAPRGFQHPARAATAVLTGQRAWTRLPHKVSVLSPLDAYGRQRTANPAQGQKKQCLPFSLARYQ